MNEAETRLQYPIGAVARRTGISPHTLRAWERRYGVVTPSRAADGTRLYSSADVLRLRLLRRAVAEGHPIGRVASRPVEELVALLGSDAEGAAPAAGSVPSSGETERVVAECLEAVEAMDAPRIRAALMRAVVTLGAAEFAEGVVAPVLRRVGELWEGGEICPAHEHLLSAQVQAVLAWVLGSVSAAPGAATAVVTTPSGHRHELAALLAGLEAAGEGWRVVYLGPDLPAADVATAVSSLAAEVVLLSVVRRVEEAALCGELERLRGAVDPEVAILVGGAGAEPHARAVEAAGARWVPELRGLRAVLRSRRDAGATA